MYLDKEIVLFCAFRYALGRHTYVVGSVISELKSNYNELSPIERGKYSEEIYEYYKDRDEDIWKDEDDWMRLAWLFDDTKQIKIRAHHHKSDKYDDVTAIKGDNGKYYSIPRMLEYHTVEELTETNTPPKK